VRRDIVLGWDDPTQYCLNSNHPYFGAIIGRYANRIANGTFTLNNVIYHTPLNDNDWDTLHGGTIGYDRRIWDVEYYDTRTLRLRYFSPDGEMGFPGNLQVNVTYTLTDSDEWDIHYSAKSDKDTIVNLSQHAYWNLNGFINNTQTALDHVLHIAADRYVLTDSHLIPTGNFGDVKVDFWMDFATPKNIGKDITHGTVTPQGGYDNAFAFSSNASFRAVVYMNSPLTGISLEMRTDQPSVQFYSGNFLDGTIPRKKDQTYGGVPQYYQHWGCAVLEAQHFPDSIHHPQWPSTVLRSGLMYTQHTSYRLTNFQIA